MNQTEILLLRYFKNIQMFLIFTTDSIINYVCIHITSLILNINKNVKNIKPNFKIINHAFDSCNRALSHFFFSI